MFRWGIHSSADLHESWNLECVRVCTHVCARAVSFTLFSLCFSLSALLSFCHGLHFYSLSLFPSLSPSVAHHELSLYIFMV